MIESLVEGAGVSSAVCLFPSAPETNRFPEPAWSSIVAAMDAENDHDRKALGDLLTTYRASLLSYLENKFFYTADFAEDLLHDFILHLIKSDLLAKFRPAKSNDFKKYLLCTLHTFAVSQYRRRTTLKRKPTNGLVALDELVETQHPTVAGDVTSGLDVEWAQEILSEALQRMRKDCEANGRSDIWRVFENRLLKPILDGDEPQGYEDLVREFKMASPAQAHNLLITAKRSCARFINEVVREHTIAQSGAEDGIQQLECIFSEAA